MKNERRNQRWQSAESSAARTIHGSHERFLKTYFSRFPGLYDTEDGVRRGGDNYYRITGRIYDVLNMSGHRMGTAGLEGVLEKQPAVAETSVVRFPHEIKGQGSTPMWY